MKSWTPMIYIHTHIYAKNTVEFINKADNQESEENITLVMQS